MPVVLVGADSRAAAAIAARLPDHTIVGIARRTGPGERRVVGDYAEVPPDLPLAGAAIVICAGSDKGTRQELRHINVDVPLAWARAGSARGARHLVQISSFSVYGGAAAIDASTPTDPQGDYGRSKLAAEQALAAMAGSMAISVLRVPILVAPAGARGAPDKLARLAGMIARLSVVPAPATPVRRSMISYDGLAAAVETLLAAPSTVSLAADPQPFTYELVRGIARDCGLPLRRLPVPRAAAALLGRAVPAMADRLFASSVLSEEANLLAGRSDFMRIDDVIGSHFARSG